ncbi:hypothetical protein THRCLA_22589 [Thraustotheca clavata]|uniref:Uncharacterized protein n=1 Tax=Thraustotheca clavata TaxID=74557 RepID=A0A1V9YWU0_9STRA|nr:hypothetical protein THRCLA_22589 [Thraustotheca clavata]
MGNKPPAPKPVNVPIAHEVLATSNGVIAKVHTNDSSNLTYNFVPREPTRVSVRAGSQNTSLQQAVLYPKP